MVKILVIVNFKTITEMDFRSLLDFACHFRLSVTPEGTMCIFGGMLLTWISAQQGERAAHFRM